MAMSARRTLFIERYLTHFQPLKAAEEAGVKPNKAPEFVVKTLDSEEVQNFIAEKIISAELNLDKDYVLTYLDRINRMCLGEIPVRTETNEDGVEQDIFEFRPAVSLRAVELVGKHLAMFTEKVMIEDKTNEKFIDKLMGEMPVTDLRELAYN